LGLIISSTNESGSSSSMDSLSSTYASSSAEDSEETTQVFHLSGIYQFLAFEIGIQDVFPPL
jgi:hypothetical protein